MPDKKKGRPETFLDKLRKKAEEGQKFEALRFEIVELYAIEVDDFKEQTFTKGERSWVSKVYRGTRFHYDDKGNLDKEEPVRFFGNTVLDNNLTIGKINLIVYLGNEKGYHDFQITTVTRETLAELAA